MANIWGKYGKHDRHYFRGLQNHKIKRCLDPDAGKDWGQEEKGMTEAEMVGWHHRLNGHEFWWTLGVDDGQGSLVCYSSWGCKELDTAEQLNWSPWKKIYDKPRQLIKSRDITLLKGPYSQSYSFSTSHVQIWELGHKTRLSTKERMLLNCGAGENSSESLGLQGDPKSVNPKGNQPWIFIGRTDAEAETPMLWPPDVKSWLIRKDPDAEKEWRQGKGMTEDEMAGWHHWFNGH